MPNLENLSPFETLLKAIISQQLHAKAAATILGRLKALVDPDRFPSAEEVLKLDAAKLRAAGVSGSKAGAIRDLATRAAEGSLPDLKELQDMSNDAIIENLTTIRGIGPWTVEMLLIFRLGRVDVLPIHDYALRYALQLIYRKRKLPTPKEFGALGASWAPYRSYASLYLWNFLDSRKKLQAALSR